jgi:hypothetical protein
VVSAQLWTKIREFPYLENNEDLPVFHESTDTKP